MDRKTPEQHAKFSEEQLKDIERTFLDPEYLIMLANALKAERNARIEAEIRLNQILSAHREKSVYTNNASIHSNTSQGSALTLKQAAQRLNVCTKTVSRRIKEGKLRAYTIGEKGRGTLVRITEADLQSYIKQSKINTQG